jgi:hypothetical protein
LINSSEINALCYGKGREERFELKSVNAKDWSVFCCLELKLKQRIRTNFEKRRKNVKVKGVFRSKNLKI